jgi:hypothetical protein
MYGDARSLDLSKDQVQTMTGLKFLESLATNHSFNRSCYNDAKYFSCSLCAKNLPCSQLSVISGRRYYHEFYGAVFSDYSMGTGIPFLTTDHFGNSTFPDSTLFGDPGCIVATFTPDRNLGSFAEVNPCPEKKAVCMRKFGDYDIFGFTKGRR